MKKTFLPRWLAMLLCLALLGTTALAEEAESVEAPVQEEAEFALGEADTDPAPVDEPLAEDLPAPLEDPEEQLIAAPEAEPEPAAETPVEPVAAPADPGVRSFAQTAAVASETWQDVNLVRAAGFTGALAEVTDVLTLANTRIDGKPAREADLGAYFALGPTGAIRIQDGAALALSLDAFSFNKGDKKTLTATLNGAKLSAKKVKWTSSDGKVTSVKSGKVTGKKAGTAVITASYKGETARCLVVVTNYKKVKSLKLNKKKLTLALYAAQPLKLTIKPADAFEPGITWSSSKPNVASVDQDGLVAGLAGGTATITVKSANGKKATCKVTVKEIKPKGIALPKAFIRIAPGEIFAAKASLTPATVSNPTVNYASSNPAVATVDGNGNITGVARGTAVITAVTASNGKKASCKVSVLEPGAKRLEGLIIGINPGHQAVGINKLYPMAPGSGKKGKGVRPGARGHYTKVCERDTTLAVGLKLRDLLEAEGATVVMTRTTNDVMLTNIDRAKMLNNAGCDVALQLHCDAVNNSGPEGCHAIYRTNTEHAKANKALAKAVVSAVKANCGCKSRGWKSSTDYMSLNWTTTPSILLEMGFISNRKEDRLLASDDYRNKMAEGIFNGLCNYFGR